jgi:hypothetical protein
LVRVADDPPSGDVTNSRNHKLAAGELTLLLTCARTAGMQAALLNLSASAINPTDVFQLVGEFEAFES